MSNSRYPVRRHHTGLRPADRARSGFPVHPTRLIDWLGPSNPEPRRDLGHEATDSAEGIRELWAMEPDRTVGRVVGKDLTGAVGWTEPNAREDVARLEVLLGHLGYKDLGLTEGPTGYFGAPQQSAIKQFQSDHGLKSDGLVLPDGPTWSTLTRLSRTPTARPFAQSVGAASGDGGTASPGSSDGEQGGESWSNPPVPSHKPVPPTQPDQGENDPDKEEEPEEEEPEKPDCDEFVWDLYGLNQERDDVNAALRHAEQNREYIEQEIANINGDDNFHPTVLIPDIPVRGRWRRIIDILSEIGTGKSAIEELVKERRRRELRAKRAQLQAELQELEAQIPELQSELAALDAAIDATKAALEACRAGDGPTDGTPGDGTSGDEAPGGEAPGDGPPMAASQSHRILAFGR